MGAPRVFIKIIDLFKQHEGREISLDFICRETGLDRKQVMSGLKTARQHLPGIEWVVIGASLRYSGPIESPAQVTKRVFEEIAVTKAGDIVIQDETGTLYRATEL